LSVVGDGERGDWDRLIWEVGGELKYFGGVDVCIVRSVCMRSTSNFVIKQCPNDITDCPVGSGIGSLTLAVRRPVLMSFVIINERRLQ
jgi:hypothetical protein